MYERRLRIVAAAGGLFFLVLVFTLFRMQVLAGAEWRARARRLGYRSVTLSARRGRIFDRNGRVLAEDRLKWDLVVRFDRYDGSSWICAKCGRPAISSSSHPPRHCPACGGRKFVPGPSRDLSRLIALLGISPAEFAKEIGAARAEMAGSVEREIARRESRHIRTEKAAEVRLFARRWFKVQEGVDIKVVRAVTVHPWRYRGLSVRSAWRRECDAKGAVARVVGSVSRPYATDKRWLRAAGYSLAQIYDPDLVVGRTGLERTFEKRLGARGGHRRIYRGEAGEPVVLPGEVPARDGEDVRSSLSTRLTQLASKALDSAGRRSGAKYGAFVALDPESGEVIALASYSANPKDQLYYPLQALVPGSVFKIVTALAGLSSKSLDPSDVYDCTSAGYHSIHCHEAHGPVDLTEAIAVSCNGYFARAAERMGITALDDWAGRLGFNAPTGIELPKEMGGLVPGPEWKARRHEQVPKIFPSATFGVGETREAGFGQGAVLVTPVQVARLMAIVANGGYFVRPTLLLGHGKRGPRVVPARAVELVRIGMRECVTRGTARRIGFDGYDVSGKTGTADLSGGRGNMAWFAGFAPSDDPKVAFACCLGEVPTYGAATAGPVVREYLRGYFGR